VAVIFFSESGGNEHSYQMLVHFGKAVFRGEDFLEIDQSETRIACNGHVC
jgi:hypothetical protein